MATIRGGETRVDGGSALAFAIGLLVTDAPGLQATAFRLFEVSHYYRQQQQQQQDGHGSACLTGHQLAV